MRLGSKHIDGYKQPVTPDHPWKCARVGRISALSHYEMASPTLFETFAPIWKILVSTRPWSWEAKIKTQNLKLETNHAQGSKIGILTGERAQATLCIQFNNQRKYELRTSQTNNSHCPVPKEFKAGGGVERVLFW